MARRKVGVGAKTGHVGIAWQKAKQPFPMYVVDLYNYTAVLSEEPAPSGSGHVWGYHMEAANGATVGMADNERRGFVVVKGRQLQTVLDEATRLLILDLMEAW